jgi:hypothetical protein
MDNISRRQKHRVGWKVPKRTKTKRWSEHLQLIPKIAYEAKQRSVIRRQHGLGIVASVGLYRTPYQLMPYRWRVHSRLRRIELKILMNHHRAQSQQVPSIKSGDQRINDIDVVISGDTTQMAKGQHLLQGDHLARTMCLLNPWRDNPAHKIEWCRLCLWSYKHTYISKIFVAHLAHSLCASITNDLNCGYILIWLDKITLWKSFQF